MSKPARFTQSDVARAAKGMAQAGFRVTGTRIEPNGAIVVMTDAGAPTGAPNRLDRILR